MLDNIGILVIVLELKGGVMNIQIVTGFFMWCSIINIGLMILSALLLISAGDFVYRMHGKLFPMPRETFNAVIYLFLGVYKIMIIVFNLVPWAALAIIG